VSDTWPSKYGRRRPFILACSIIVSAGLLILGFTKEIVSFFLPEGDAAKTMTIILAVLALYATDFAINAVMSCSRSLVVDTLPLQKQQSGAAWMSRMGSIGNIMGYSAGAVDLVGLLGTWLGNTQFKILSLIAAAGILSTSCITCWAVSERIYVAPSEPERMNDGRFKIVREILSSIRSMPARMQAICWIVFWSWIGWFPFLVYSSTWVGEIYYRNDVPADMRNSKDVLGDMGRVGSTALTVYSMVTFSCAWLLPLFVQSPDDGEESMFTPPERLARFLEKFKDKKPDLLTLWYGSAFLFAGVMVLAPLVSSFRFATLLVAACGFAWALTMWAPTAFMGVEVNKVAGGAEHGTAAYRRLSVGSANIELTDSTMPGGVPPPQPAESNGELSGTYFGILNIAATVPQFIATFIATVVFHIVEPGKSPELAHDADPSEHHSTDGPNAISILLFIGAIAMAGSAYLTTRLKYIP
jgi:solute carrier family 45, member 1/2/4